MVAVFQDCSKEGHLTMWTSFNFILSAILSLFDYLTVSNVSSEIQSSIVEVSGSEVVTMKDHAEYDPSVKLFPSLPRAGIGQIIQHPIGFCLVVIESTILIVYVQFYCLDCKSWIACAVFCGNECHLEYFSNGLKQKIPPTFWTIYDGRQRRDRTGRRRW